MNIKPYIRVNKRKLFFILYIQKANLYSYMVYEISTTEKRGDKNK